MLTILQGGQVPTAAGALGVRARFNPPASPNHICPSLCLLAQHHPHSRRIIRLHRHHHQGKSPSASGCLLCFAEIIASDALVINTHYYFLGVDQWLGSVHHSLSLRSSPQSIPSSNYSPSGLSYLSPTLFIRPFFIFSFVCHRRCCV